MNMLKTGIIIPKVFLLFMNLVAICVQFQMLILMNKTLQAWDVGLLETFSHMPLSGN